MSIVNRRKIDTIVSNASQTASLDASWRIIMYVTFVNVNTELEKFICEQSMSSFKSILGVKKIYLYTTSDATLYRDIAAKYDIQLIDIFSEFGICSRLAIAKKYIDNHFNVIIIDNWILFMKNSTVVQLINNSSDISTYIIPIQESSLIYSNVASRLNMTNIIHSNMLIVPYSVVNKKYIDYSYAIICRLQITNEETASNIALTTSYYKNITNVKNIITSVLQSNFLNNNYQKHHILIRELQLIAKHGPPCLDLLAQQLKVIYNQNNYIYYPCMDITQASTISTFDFTQHILPTIFNTNGFMYELDTQSNYYSSMVKRFDVYDNIQENILGGLFVKKTSGDVIVPKILHHVWMNNEPSINYLNSWSKVLQSPWQYIIWTESTIIRDVFPNSRWSDLYYNETSTSVKMIIVYLAILEKYGGFIIDSYTLPLRLIPDEMLFHKFMISFLDENKYGTKLSFRIMSAIPGLIDSYILDPKLCEYDPARRPFEGMNNFFINLKTQKISNVNVVSNTITSSSFYDKLHSIISSSLFNVMKAIEDYLITQSDIMIYPSYYFEPNYYYPKRLLQSAVCINLWEPIPIITHVKTELKRTYCVSTAGIMAKLTENPRDRFRSNGKLE